MKAKPKKKAVTKSKLKPKARKQSMPSTTPSSKPRRSISALLLSGFLLLASSITVGVTPVKSMYEFAGTGYFVTNDGYILTNRHVAVVAQNKKAIIEYHGAYRNATVVYVSQDRDVAVLKMDGPTPCLKISPNAVLAVGTPYNALILDMMNGADFFAAKWIVHPDVVQAIQPNFSFEGTPQVTYPNLGVSGQYARPGNSGSPILNPQTNEVIGMVFGGGSISLLGMHMFISTAVLQDADIQKVIKDSGVPIVCENPTTTPINDTNRIILYTDVMPKE